MKSFSAVTPTPKRCWLLRGGWDFQGGQPASQRGRLAIALMVSLALLVISIPACAFDFEDFCPVQAPSNWTAAAWSQFRDSCIADDLAHDRHLFDDCMRKCTSVNQALGRAVKLKPLKMHSAPGEPPLNPNWCSSVPVAFTPLQGVNHPGDWERIRQGCMNTAPIDEVCRDECEALEDLWQRKKSGYVPGKPTLPLSTNVPQGPFPLPGGGNGYIVPLPPTPAAAATPAAPQSSTDPTNYPPGPFSSFAAQDIDAISNGLPPDVAADVSPTQNVEFTNFLGMYVYNKPALPVGSPAPTPAAIYDRVDIAWDKV